MIGNPLGRSDRAVLHAVCDMEETLAQEKKTIYLYEKANYELLRRELEIDWKEYLSDASNIEEMWSKFKSKLHVAIEKSVPTRRTGNFKQYRKRTNENLPMNKILWSKIKRKQRLWMRMKSLKGNLNAFSRTMYMETEKEYRRLNNQIRKETRNAVKFKEKEIAKNVKENPKVFCKYVQSKVKSKPRIPDLQKGTAEDVKLKMNRRKLKF